MKMTDFDFEAMIRILPYEEGGRASAACNGIRWDFNYAMEPPQAGLYMIYPDFLGEDGQSVRQGQPLPVNVPLRARMRILRIEMRAFHHTRISPGVRFYCCEGAQRVAEGAVTRVTGLLDLSLI